MHRSGLVHHPVDSGFVVLGLYVLRRQTTVTAWYKDGVCGAAAIGDWSIGRIWSPRTRYEVQQ